MTDTISLGNILTIIALAASAIWQLASIRGQIDAAKEQISSLKVSMENQVDSLEHRLEERISLQERAHQHLATSYALIAGMVDRHDVYVRIVANKCLGAAATQELCPHVDSSAISVKTEPSS